MIAKENRLSNFLDVQRISRKGRSFFKNIVTVKFLPKYKEKPRFTIVISKKIDKRAVYRNRLRRLMQSEIFTHINQLKFDFIIYTKPEIRKFDEKQIRSIMSEIVADMR